MGQALPPGASAPVYGPCARLDYELELGIFIGQGNGPARLSHTSFKHQYWSIAQMVTQHTMGGCNLQSGDLLGSGTISGPTAAETGAMIELTVGGRQPITLEGGDGQPEQRGFLQD